MKYKFWVYIALGLFAIGLGIGLIIGLVMPSSIVPFFSREMLALQELAGMLGPFKFTTAVFILLKNFSALFFSFILSPLLCLFPIMALLVNGGLISFVSVIIAGEESVGFVLAGLLPHGVFAQAVGTAVFPTFAAQAARGETGALRETLTLMVRVIVAVTLPAAVGLMALGQPVIAVVFQRGEFDATSTQAVAWALTFYAVGLVGLSAIEVLARAFYALHDTWTPALAALLSVALNVVLGLTLPSVFAALDGGAHSGGPHGGLALASALAFTVQMAVLLVLIYRRIGGFDARGLAGQALRVLLASAGMGVVLWGWMRVAPESTLVQSIGGVAIGVIVYAALALLLRVDELKQVTRMLLRRS